MLRAAGGAATSIHAVRIQVIPRPRTLAASRQILRILQSYGDVTTYRSLKHDPVSDAPNSAMAIFKDESAMHAFLQDCPITHRLESTDPHELAQAAGTETDSSPPLPPSPEAASLLARQAIYTAGDGLERGARSRNTKPKTRLVRISGDIWRGNHRDWLERHPFWGRFDLNRLSICQQDLARRVPLVGLSDIDAKSQREISLRIINQRRAEFASRPTLKERIEALKSCETAQHG